MQLHFIDPDGKECLVEAEIGESVMRSATRAMIPGIVGECGGVMACATCHCYVTMADGAHLPGPSEEEQDMVDGCLEPRPESRLTCQVVVGPELAQVIFTVPPFEE